MEKDVEYKDNFFRNVNTELNKEDISMLSPLQLAYLGDAVYELLIRTRLMNKDLNVNKLHKSVTKYVKAQGQADIIKILDKDLTEAERSYVKKGRNTKINTSPKNANLLDYKYATGFECLLGYLYISGQDKRISEIFSLIMNLNI